MTHTAVHRKAFCLLRRTSVVLLILLALPGCLPAASVVVTTTLLGAAARILTGPDTEIQVLLPPGACPGHADITPSALLKLQSADVILYHAFQAHMAEQWKKAGLSAEVTYCCTASGALTIPENFHQLTKELVPVFVRRLHIPMETVQTRLASFSERLETETEWAKSRLAPAAACPVLAAEIQREFCSWAGLGVVASWRPLEGLAPRELTDMRDRCKEHSVTVCIGNLQWGARSLDDLSRTLGLKSVMLSNFPASADEAAYMKLLHDNVEAIRPGCAPE